MALTKIKAAAMAANSVDSDQYVDGSIDNAHLADDAVDSDEIAAGAIDTAHIADNQVNGDKLTDNIDIAGTLDVTGAAVFDSTITSVGNINTGGNPWVATANGGILYYNGTTAFSSDQNNFGLWRGYTTGTNAVTSEIFANGSGSFAGSVSAESFTSNRSGSSVCFYAQSSGTTNATITAAGNATFAGTVSDSKGDLRKVIQNTQGSTYTLVAADAGKHILASGTVTIPDSVFAAGDAVTIVNNTASDLTITKTITTMYMASDATSANRTLATRGMATILFASGTVAYISGAGLS